MCLGIFPSAEAGQVELQQERNKMFPFSSGGGFGLESVVCIAPRARVGIVHLSPPLCGMGLNPMGAQHRDVTPSLG